VVENLTAKEAAERLRCSVSQVYKLYANGELRGYAVGRKKIIFADSIDEYIARNANPLPFSGRAGGSGNVTLPPRNGGLRHLRL